MSRVRYSVACKGLNLTIDSDKSKRNANVILS